MQEAIAGAAAVPMSVLERCPEIARMAGIAADRGLRASLSDAGVAASCARAASEGAYFNVMINIAQLEDSAKAASTAARAKALLDETAALSEGVLASVRSSLGSPAAGGERRE